MSDQAFQLNPDVLLAWIFKETERAGFGIANGITFEAFPGCEDAAADFIQDLVGDDE